MQGVEMKRTAFGATAKVRTDDIPEFKAMQEKCTPQEWDIVLTMAKATQVIRGMQTVLHPDFAVPLVQTVESLTNNLLTYQIEEAGLTEERFNQLDEMHQQVVDHAQGIAQAALEIDCGGDDHVSN